MAKYQNCDALIPQTMSLKGPRFCSKKIKLKKVGNLILCKEHREIVKFRQIEK